MIPECHISFWAQTSIMDFYTRLFAGWAACSIRWCHDMNLNASIFLNALAKNPQFCDIKWHEYPLGECMVDV
ncbi:MAG: hypothetical protein NVSMB27_11440 [Ktedonobacteraceae bacterium]